MNKRFDVTGMTCSACQANVTRAVEKLGVDEVNVNLISESMSVDYDPDKISEEDIVKAVEKIGYGASPKDREKSKSTTATDDSAKEEDNTRFRLKVSLIFMIPLLYLAMGPMVGLPLPWFLTGREGALNNAITQFILTIPVLFVNRKFFINGFKGLINRAPNMDTLVALGASAATFYGIFVIMRMAHGLSFGQIELVDKYMHNLYFESAAVILTLITVGKYFEAKSKGRTKASLENLINLAPKQATVIVDGKEKVVDVADISRGDIILIKPGDSIPVDGEIIEGSSLVDEAAITGESIPVNKTVSDEVISATINKQGSFKFKATHVGEDTTLAQIINLVNEANETKAPIAQMADKISAIFVPAVIVISILTFAIWRLMGYDFEFALNLMIAVLVISCPCALGLATPMAIMVSTGKSAELGLLFKNAEALENLHKVDTILMDKTGTITEGKPVVTDVATKMDENKFLKIASSIEKSSEHPLSTAIVNYANDNNIEAVSIENFEAISGKGIRATIDGVTYIAGNKRLMEEENINFDGYQNTADKYSNEGKTSMYFADENQVIGLIAVKDLPKATSKIAIDELKNLGYEVTMITGDNAQTAEAIRKDLGIDEKFAEVLPQDKDKVVRQLQEKGKKVTMVGDGINDAPALARSDIGMAIGNGTDVAIDSADVVLMRNSLLDIVSSIELSKATIKTIKQNLFWAFFYNIILIPVAAGLLYPFTGITLNPMFAAFAMSISSIFVCINSLRLRGFKPEFKNQDKIDKINAEMADKEEHIQTNQNEFVNENKGENQMSDANKLLVNVNGMSCEHCEKSVKKALENLAPVDNANVSAKENSAEVTYHGSVDEDQIKEAISEAGYEFGGIEYK